MTNKLLRIFGQRHGQELYPILFDEKSYEKIQKGLDKEQANLNKFLERINADISSAA